MAGCFRGLCVQAAVSAVHISVRPVSNGHVGLALRGARRPVEAGLRRGRAGVSGEVDAGGRGVGGGGAAGGLGLVGSVVAGSGVGGAEHGAVVV